ncbi:MAG TPA: hypothetical protein VKB92_02250 [Myxococcales bacterium]|nr:hypothetical protein [Myxococcales bacterium]
MKYLAVALMFVAGAAKAQSDGVWEPTRPAPAAYASPRLPAHVTLEPGVCDPADAPLQWLDASDPLTFAGSSLAQLSNDDAAFLRLRSLVELRVTLASLRLFVVGASPFTWARLQFAPGEGRWKLSNC